MRRSIIALLLTGVTAAAVAHTIADKDSKQQAARTATFFQQMAATRRRAEQSARPSPASEARPQRPTGAASKFGAVAPLDQHEKIIHALDRLTWGPAPGDVAEVEKIGLKKWIDLQLHPDRIPENPDLVSQLKALPTVQMSSGDLLQHYPPPQLVRAMAAGRQPLPSDPQARTIVALEARQMLRQEEKRDNQQQGPAAGAPNAAAPQANPAAFRLDGLQNLVQQLPADAEPQPLRDLLGADEVQRLRRGNPSQKLATLAALSPDKRDLVLRNLPRGMANQMLPWLPMDEAREVELHVQPQAVIPNDLESARILRAVYTNRQLQDVLTDFWFNHFNVFINKGADRYLITSYERDAIRPHVLGRFSDLLLATAESPAMLFYLDNWQSVDPNAVKRMAQQRQQMLAQRRARMMARGGMFGPGGRLFPPLPRQAAQKQKKKAAKVDRGINENYGRELMELHTLGVNGGYTQQDVIEVARCFTGWTIRDLNGNPEFFYNDRLHDKGAKVVLGVKIPSGGGMSDGLRVIEILSHSPATAHHISFELAQRFVADQPPPALVDRMAKTFLDSNGDLRKVMQTMLDSPEFWQQGYDRSKVKSPLEMVVSSLRALGANVQNPLQLTRVVAQMGEPLYGMEPPTGYANTGDAWVSSAGLIARLNFALALAANRFPGVTVDLARFAPGDANLQQVTNGLFQSLLRGEVSPGTRATVERLLARASGQTQPMADDGNPHPATPGQTQMVAGLILGSPEFQKH